MSLLGRCVYLDASATIHTIEDYAVYPNLVTGLLKPIDEGKLVAVTSELTLLEVLVKPRKMNDLPLEQAFRDFLGPSKVRALPIDLPVLERAVDLRLLGLKTPDAIHIATGMLEGCDLFLTRDKDWAKAGVTVADPNDVA